MESQEPSESRDEFGRGVLAGIAGFAVIVVGMWIGYGVMYPAQSSGLGTIVAISATILGVFWLPGIFVAGAIARRRGFRAAVWFVVASAFVSYLAFGGCVVGLNHATY